MIAGARARKRLWHGMANSNRTHLTPVIGHKERRGDREDGKEMSLSYPSLLMMCLTMTPAERKSPRMLVCDERVKLLFSSCCWS